MDGGQIHLVEPAPRRNDDAVDARMRSPEDRDAGVVEDASVPVVPEDAAPAPSACDGACGDFVYNACTCDDTDPCGWSNDGTCDSRCYAYLGAQEIFRDFGDCAVQTRSGGLLLGESFGPGTQSNGTFARDLSGSIVSSGTTLPVEHAVTIRRVSETGVERSMVALVLRNNTSAPVCVEHGHSPRFRLRNSSGETVVLSLPDAGKVLGQRMRLSSGPLLTCAPPGEPMLIYGRPFRFDYESGFASATQVEVGVELAQYWVSDPDFGAALTSYATEPWGLRMTISNDGSRAAEVNVAETGYGFFADATGRPIWYFLPPTPSPTTIRAGTSVTVNMNLNEFLGTASGVWLFTYQGPG